jgi:hypothetical protein
VVRLAGVKEPGLMARMHPENRLRVIKLLEGRERRRAAILAHSPRWPQTMAQVGPVMDDIAKEEGGDQVRGGGGVPGHDCGG